MSTKIIINVLTIYDHFEQQFREREKERGKFILKTVNNSHADLHTLSINAIDRLRG